MVGSSAVWRIPGGADINFFNRIKMEMDSWVSAIIDSSLQTAKNFVCSGQEVVPQVFLVAREDGDPAVFPVIGVEKFFDSKESKRKLRPFVKLLWDSIALNSAFKLLAVVVVSDAWVEYVSVPEFEKIMERGRDRPFSPKPGMAEALVVQVSLAEAELQYKWPYVRGEKEVVFAAEPSIEKAPDGPKALVMGLWPL